MKESCKHTISNYPTEKSYRIRLLLIFGVFLLLWSSCEKTDKIPNSPAKFNSFSEIQEHFENPPVEFHSVPFMVWNGEVTKEKIKAQLESLKTSGCGGVFIHPRWGMITEYLDDNWYDLVHYTVKEGKKLNMQIWLYDENSFPSGFAGGHVADQMPDSYQREQGIVLHKMTHLKKNSIKNYFKIHYKTDNEFIDITSNTNEYLNKKGEFYLYKYTYKYTGKRFGGFSYVDLIMPGVTEKFIDVTMTGYETKFKDEFGKAVPGIFTDEPNIAPPNVNSIRYTPGLFELFEAKYQYKLEYQLHCLFEKKDQWKKVRHDYHKLLLELFIENWSIPWYEYCEENKLKWTGHYWEHGWPSANHGGDNMAMYAWHQTPGIDLLFNNYKESVNAQFGNIRAVKELSSVANQMGRNRTLCETYGAAGWSITFEDMKKNGDWMYAMGVNLMNQHLSFMDIHGERKHDFPQSFSYHANWWPKYKYLNDYFSRLSMVLSSGQQINNILIIEPTTSTWMYAEPGQYRNDSLLNSIGNQFQDFVNQLEKKHFEYDLASEILLERFGSIEDKQFVVNERKYSLVILPPGMENIESSTIRLLHSYLNNGGKVIASNSIPAYLNGEISEKTASLNYEFSNIFKVEKNYDSLFAQLEAYSNEFKLESSNKSAGNIFHNRRILTDGQVLFLVNSHPSENAAGSFEINGKSVFILNGFDGTIKPYPSTANGKVSTVEFDIPPAGSALFIVKKSGKPYTQEFREQISFSKKASGHNFEVIQNNENVLPLDYCDLTIEGRTDQDLYFFKAQEKIFDHHGFDENPWMVSVQYKKNILDSNSFKENSGFRAEYFFEVDPMYKNVSSLKAVVELPNIFTVKINGKKIKPEKDMWWLDKSFGVYRIGQYINHGRNSITLEVQPMHILAELQPIYLIGDFHLISKEKGWLITNTKPTEYGWWKDLGMPFYSGTVSYLSSYSFTKNQPAKIAIGNWQGSVAEVFVNDSNAGIICSPPYELDITDNIINGENIIEVKIYGCMTNQMGPYHQVQSRNRATPWSWRYAPENQPSGNAYETEEYGMKTPFSVFTSE